MLNRLQKFLDFHFADGESNTPDWRQEPYCNDLFKIYKNAISCGLSNDDIAHFVRTQWNITLQTHPTSLRSKQIEELCSTLFAWDLYDRCASQERST